MTYEQKTAPKESCLADETKETRPIESKIDDYQSKFNSN